MLHRARADSRPRAGLTLTEILIAILIMGVGMISLATLFPLGIQRIRDANRQSRSGMLFNTAYSDLQTRLLLSKRKFTGTWYQWPSGTGEPMIHDPIDPTNPSTTGGVFRLNGQSLPFAYDPLWRSLTATLPVTPITAAGPEARFAAGVVKVGSGVTNLIGRNDPDGGAPSAWGLQRLTNMPVGNRWGTQVFSTPTYPANIADRFTNYVGGIFASQDDLVYQDEGNLDLNAGTGSELLPYIDPNSGTMSNDWSYTWAYTGQQESTDRPRYLGDIVIFHNRPFGLENDGTATGERVIEAIFGYSSTIKAYPAGSSIGYSQNDKVVLLRWPASEPDPEIRVNSWIADVTYERTASLDASRFQNTLSSGQRCHWYRVIKKTPAVPEAGSTQAPSDPNYRRMTVFVDSPLLDRTLIQQGGAPVHLNAAFVSPYVVNVIPAWVPDQDQAR